MKIIIRATFLFLFFLICTNQTVQAIGAPSSLHMIQSHKVPALFIANLTYIAYFHDTNEWKVQRPFRAGMLSSCILGATMVLIEYGTQTYFNTNLFLTSIPYQALKITIAACTAMGFSAACGAYNDISQNKKHTMAYLKGLVSGVFLLLPFCSDL